MTIKNGDLPAMPLWCANSDQQLYGLTKREHFAMAAMKGLLSGENGDAGIYDDAGDWVKNVTESSVEFADALLAELERTK